MTDSRHSSPPDNSLRYRADLLRHIRRFMDDRGILEVETPVMVSAPVTDPAIESFVVSTSAYKNTNQNQYYLQTSPEYAMKRMLVDGSGHIYQIARVFRQDETGPWHNPEFTMLEWYRPGFDQFQLMDEIDELLVSLGLVASQRNTYQEIFLKITGIDPITANEDQLNSFATSHGLASKLTDHSDLLDFIFSHNIADALSHEPPTLIHSFPNSQAALAQINPDGVTAARFELFIHGIEIANGFQELTDAKEQRSRFQQDNSRRRAKGLVENAIDEKFLNALESGLPECSGVALGIDRLLMVLHGFNHIKDVIRFTTDAI